MAFAFASNVLRNRSGGTVPADSNPRTLNILGSRGIPAGHGGFETFAEKVSLGLVARGWKVRVYTQIDPETGAKGAELVGEDVWHGVERVLIAAPDNPLGTIAFDWVAMKDVIKRDGIDLTLGYNTGCFSLLARLLGRTNIINMDGIEWKRKKWSLPAKAWLFLNERCALAAAHLVVCDNPGIEAHHRKAVPNKKMAMIPYGAYKLQDVDNPQSILQRYGLSADQYFISVARIEPENSVLEIVQSFAAAKASGQLQGTKLMVLGNLNLERPYHAEVQAAGEEVGVIFPGAIFDDEIVGTLRKNSLSYVHGHTVGGTNPSLVEALGSGAACICHDNEFNAWTAGPEQGYFGSVEDLMAEMLCLANDPELRAQRRSAASDRHAKYFEWEHITDCYEEALLGEIRVPAPFGGEVPAE